MLEVDVIIAFNTYMQFLYMIGGIRCPTKVYFGLSTLAGDSRCDNFFLWDLHNSSNNTLCIHLPMFCSQNHKRKYNAQDFDKSKASNLLKMLKGEHPTKKWQNCGTEVLCVMLMYDGAELARIVEKVLGI